MKKLILSVVTAAMLLPALSLPAHATYHSEKRQDARHTRQESRTDGRQEKRDCVRADDKSNASCRQDKRENRRDGRQEARDVKW